MLVKAIYCFFRVLPLEIASKLGAFLARNIGFLHPVGKLAHNNIKQSFPDLDDNEVNKIVDGALDNLGRVTAEIAHMEFITGDEFRKRVKVEGEDSITDAIKRGGGTIFFSGHLANWEMIPKTLRECGIADSMIVYRKANNPYVEKLILDARKTYSSDAIPKGSIGARKLIKAVKAGKSITMLVDQKQNDGIAVPFLGRDAMTASAIATMALKYNCTLVPVQIIREKGVNFKVKLYPPLKIEKTDDNDKDILTIMTTINSMLESWIRENPKQWFWVHNRWPKKNESV